MRESEIEPVKKMQWRVTVAMAAGALLMLQAPAHADQRAESRSAGEQIAQSNQTRSFAIPAQPLASALDRFADQTGISFAYRTGDLSTLRSPGVSGMLTLREALQQLLAGTGVSFAFTGANTVTITRTPDAGSGPMQLDPVQVQGFAVPQQAMIDNLPPPYAGGQVATGGQLGLLGNRDVMDTPFNQTNYTAKKAQDQQAKTIRDVLIDDPSVRAYAPQGGIGRDNFFIRGFDAGSGSNISYGGLYGMVPNYSPMVEMAERVEILKGPSAMLNGMPPIGVIGGTVNIVPKRAPDESLTQITANYISDAQFGGHLDIARRFGEDKQFGARFNAVYRGGQTSVQYNSDERALAVLGLDFRGERVRLSTDFGFQREYIGGLVPYLGIATGVSLPWAPDARKNVGQPWAFMDHKDLFGVVRAEVDLAERVTAYASFGAHDFRLEGLWTGLVTANNFNGNASGIGTTLYSQYTTQLTAEVGVRARAETGPISHELALSLTTYANQNGSASVAGPTFNTNFYNPTVIARPNLSTPAVTKTSTQNLSSLGFADTLSAVDNRIQLTVGARLQQVAAANFNPTTGAQTSAYDQSALSPAVALVFKPWQNVSIYGNFIQGLQQGATVGATYANAGEVFAPYKSTQYEVGVKVDWGKFTTTASLFQISQPSILTNVAGNTQYLGGEQRNQGLELNVFGEPMEGVRLVGGVMFLSAVLTKTQGGRTDGWIAPFAPGAQVNLGGEWDLPFAQGLTVTGRAIYTSSQYIDTTYPRRSLPEWTRFDVGARYAFENPGAKGKLLVARFSVENVLDSNYWAGGNGATTLFLGQPRTFRLALTADF